MRICDDNLIKARNQAGKPGFPGRVLVGADIPVVIDDPVLSALIVSVLSGLSRNHYFKTRDSNARRTPITSPMSGTEWTG